MFGANRSERGARAATDDDEGKSTQGDQAAIRWLSRPLPQDCSPYPYRPLHLSQRAALEWEQGQIAAAEDSIQAFSKVKEGASLVSRILLACDVEVSDVSAAASMIPRTAARA